MLYKLRKQILLILGLGIFFSCDTFKLETIKEEPKEMFPEFSSIYIPSSLNAIEETSNLKTVRGDIIYNYIRVFINTVDKANKIVEGSFNRISAVETMDILEFSYTAIDGNTKNVSIKKDFTKDSVHWDFCMEIYNQTYADLALRAYWNENQYLQKIIFKPSSLNITEFVGHPDALVEIECKSGPEAEPYEKTMFIAVHGLTITKEEPYHPNNIVVFLGQKDNILDVTGSANNPNAILLDHSFSGGRNWSFIAKVDLEKNIAIANLALPPSWIETNEGIMQDYSVKQVLIDEIRSLYAEENTLTDDEILELAGIDDQKIENPVFFNDGGFVATGVQPSSNYTGLQDFQGLSLFVPTYVRDYKIILSGTDSQ